MSLFDSASLVVTPNGTKASKLYSIIPTDGSGDLTVTRATTATRVNSAGLIESVSNNVPRLDYTNSTCPSILVEPQRTNLVLRSQEFNNATWGRFANGTASISITPDAILSPDGNTNADLVSLNRGFINEYSIFYQATNSGAGTFKGSVWLKAKDSASVGKKIDLWSAESGTIKGYTQITLTANWVRYEQVTTVFTSTGEELLSFGLLPIPFGSSTTLSVEFYIWGAQGEAGSYPTSYIPTVASSVTRNADVISKTGISSLIGQTEGTLFFEGEMKDIPLNVTIFGVEKAATNSVIRFHFDAAGQFKAQCFNGTSNLFLEIGPLIQLNTKYKFGFAYKKSDYAFYINGNLIATGSNSTDIPSCDKLETNSLWGNLGVSCYQINSSALFKRRLTNAELAQLTTI